MATRAEVEKQVASVRSDDGVLVYDFPSRKLLAARAPTKPTAERGATLVVLGLEDHRPLSGPDPLPGGLHGPVEAQDGADQGETRGSH